MMDEENIIKDDLQEIVVGGPTPRVIRFALASLSGLPLVGGLLGAGASAWSESEQKKFNKVFASWLKLQRDEIEEIGKTLAEVFIRLDQNDSRVEERIQSPAYLSIVKKCFRDWSAAESEQKRILIRNLLANAASCSLCSDDVIKLFIEWIDAYSETHFRVIGCIYKNPGITRAEIWEEIHGEDVREDSAEADLFKLIMHDLSVGHIARQHRQVDYNGNFIKTPQRRPGRSLNRVMTSAFDDNKPYELTELGRQFVHYTMNDIVPKIGSSSN